MGREREELGMRRERDSRQTVDKFERSNLPMLLLFVFSIIIEFYSKPLNWRVYFLLLITIIPKHTQLNISTICAQNWRFLASSSFVEYILFSSGRMPFRNTAFLSDFDLLSSGIYRNFSSHFRFRSCLEWITPLQNIHDFCKCFPAHFVSKE